MKFLFKILTNGRVVSAVISALGAIVSAFCAGCKLCCAELAIKDFECSITGFENENNTETNIVERIK